MTTRNIRHTDLNLLIALNVILEERNVTRAADRLGLTQSAASRMLGRLRATFDDPLFVRTSRGLTPTKRALDIAGPLQQYLFGLEKLLGEGEEFDPGTAQRRFRIAAIDYVQATLLAPLVAKLQRRAPSIDFEIRQPSSDSERDLDAVIPRRLHLCRVVASSGAPSHAIGLCCHGACAGRTTRTGRRYR